MHFKFHGISFSCYFSKGEFIFSSDQIPNVKNNNLSGLLSHFLEKNAETVNASLNTLRIASEICKNKTEDIIKFVDEYIAAYDKKGILVGEVSHFLNYIEVNKKIESNLLNELKSKYILPQQIESDKVSGNFKANAVPNITNQQKVATTVIHDENNASSSKPIANVKPQIKINDNNNKVKSNNNTYNNLSAGNTNTPNLTPQFQNNKVSNGITTQQNSNKNIYYGIGLAVASITFIGMAYYFATLSMAVGLAISATLALCTAASAPYCFFTPSSDVKELNLQYNSLSQTTSLNV